MNRFAFAAAIIVTALLPSITLAWGGDGHQRVCLIADDRLTPAAKAGIHALLGKDVLKERLETDYKTAGDQIQIESSPESVGPGRGSIISSEPPACRAEVN